MKHTRKDYSRIQDPALHDPSLLSEGSSPIGEDEPVMLFRAKDKHFPAVLSAYAQMLEGDVKNGGDPESSYDMLHAVNEQIEASLAWQAENGCKTPDLPCD